MSVETSENDLLAKTENDPAKDQDKQNPLHLLAQAIANMPDIDMEKVQAVLQKINKGALEALGNAEDRINCSERIATKIIAETLDTDQEIPQ